LSHEHSDTDYLGKALRSSHLVHAVDQVTDPWCNVILRAAFLGTRQFDSFQQVTGIPRQTLSLRLSYLTQLGLLVRQAIDSKAARHEYRLSDYGKALHGSVLAGWAWDRRWGDAMQAQLPTRLVHRDCSHAFQPQLVCEHCGDPLSLQRVEPMHLRTHESPPPRTTRNRRWRNHGSDGATHEHDILAVIDDRWSVLIVAALMLGASRYEQLLLMLEISSAVLSRRLQRLAALRIIAHLPDPADARRSLYLLDKAGQDLFAYLLTLAHWGGLTRPGADSIGWIHGGCGQRTKGRMRCSHCHGALLPTGVERSSIRHRPPS